MVLQKTMLPISSDVAIAIAIAQCEWTLRLSACVIEFSFTDICESIIVGLQNHPY